MSVAQKFPKVAPCSIQKCPLCGEDKILVAQGMVEMKKNTPEIFPDRGYSFCNCKNIWFTNWNNIDKSVVNKPDEKEMDIFLYLLNTEKLFNRGYGKNKFLLCDNPKMMEEAQRMGFDITQTSQVFENCDFIWDYHSIHRTFEPLVAITCLFNMLRKGGQLFIAMPDPYFIEFEDIYSWKHWKLRQNYIMWDMDSFCDEAIKKGFKLVMKERNFSFNNNQDMHLIFEKI